MGFFKKLKKVVKIAAPIVAAYYLGPLAGAMLGGSGAAAVTIGGALVGSATGGAIAALSGDKIGTGLLTGAIKGAAGGYAASMSAESAWAGLPLEAQKAYLDAGWSSDEIGNALRADSISNGAIGSAGNFISKGLDSAGKPLIGKLAGGLLSGGLNLAGGYLQGEAAKDASTINAQAQLDAARIAADSAKFRPVGVSTRFGASQFGYDPQGNLNSAGYTLAPDIRNQQDRLMSMASGYQSPGMINQVAAAGRGNDTQLAHINQQEAELLKSLGGAGTINPQTGLREFYTDFGTQMQQQPYIQQQPYSPPIQQQPTYAPGGGLLGQYEGAQAATAPMGQGAQSMMTLGQSYLGSSPQEQAAKYMQEQQSLLATGRERDMAGLQNRLYNQGRMGLSMGATSTGMSAANPDLEAFYNAQRQQDLGLAAQATQGGQQYANFGAGLLGGGGDMLQSMYGTQVAAYNPYKTAMGGATYLEGLGQSAMDAGINIGTKGTAGTAQAGMLMGQGMTNAANAMQPANSMSPWGNALAGAATNMNNYTSQQAMQQQQALNNQYMQAQMEYWKK